MEYSDFINRFRKDYDLTPQEVLFSILIANGCSRAESFAHIFKPSAPTDSAIRNGAVKIIKEKPQILKLVSDIQTRNKIVPLSADLDIIKEQRKQESELMKAEGWNNGESVQDNLMRIIKTNLHKLDPKDKIDAARQLAKLLGLKEETRETRHYFLPLSCKHCNLYIESEYKQMKSGK